MLDLSLSTRCCQNARPKPRCARASDWYRPAKGQLMAWQQISSCTHEVHSLATPAGLASECQKLFAAYLMSPAYSMLGMRSTTGACSCSMGRFSPGGQ